MFRSNNKSTQVGVPPGRSTNGLADVTDQVSARPAPRVLVVEDHPDTQSAVAEFLSERGFEVFVVADGESALLVARAKRPHLVYLDICLPHISGFEVCEHIRADDALRDVIVVMTSAQGFLERKAHAFDAGADIYMAKPFDLEELAQVIERSLIPN